MAIGSVLWSGLIRVTSIVCSPAARRLLSSSTIATALRDVLADVSAVVYCAGSVRGRGPEDFAAANIDGLRHLASVSSALPTPPAVLLISSLAASRPQVSNYAAKQGRR